MTREVEMDTDIKTIVEQCPLLHFQVNIGERHRIRRRGSIKRGSLWIAPRIGYFSVTPTGEAEVLLYHFLHSQFGTETGQDYKGRWKYWNITDLSDVAKVIRRFGEP